MKCIIYLCCALFLFSTCSYGEMGDYANKYLVEIQGRHSAVFFSRCKYDNNNYSASLVFEVGNSQGLLIEMKDKIVVNLATVIIGSTGAKIEETHGGVYSYERVNKLAKELIGKRFRLIAPLKIEEIFDSTPTDACVNQDGF